MIDDLKIAFNWFTHPNGKAQSHLSPNGNQTIDAIRTALSTHSLEQARQIANHVTFNPKENPLEVGEILVWAAVYALYLGEDEHIKFAKELFQNAAAKYSDDDAHYRAITMWLLGLIYWQFPEYKRDAIHHWEYSLRVLTHLSYSPESINPGWYQKIRFQIIESLFLTRLFRRYFPINDVKHLRLHPSTHPVSATTHPTAKRKTPPKRNVIRSIPVYQYVPAGGWGVVNPEEVGKAEGMSSSDNTSKTDINYFIIDETLYHAIDLIGRGQFTYQEGGRFAIVRIKGTSMNKLDIQDGDFVLIRWQEDANHTDIILAERIGIDSEATLKRLYKQGNKIELRPESNDPNNQILEVDKKDNLRILGIAVAVFKPILESEIPENYEQITLNSQEEITPEFLVSTIAPFIQAIADIQKSINKILRRPTKEIVIREFTQNSPITVSIQNAHEAIDAVNNSIIPWRKAHQQNLANLTELEKQAEIEIKKAEALEKRAHAEMNRKEAEKISAEAKKLHVEAQKLTVEVERERLQLENEKLKLALDLIKDPVPELSVSARLNIANQLLAPIGIIIKSPLEILEQPLLGTGQ